jgi:4'-phosphopantetheinyl transferase
LIKVPVYFTILESELETKSWSALLHQLPDVLHASINRYHYWQDRHRALFGKLLLIRALKDLGHPARRLFNLQYTSHERPWLEGGIEFNISHSGQYVLCAISDKCRLGIDIEFINNINLGDYSTVMTNSQWNSINNSQTPLREFYRLWTLKESVIKANGKGLSIPLNELETDYSTVLAEGIRWYLSELFFDEKYSAHLACSVPGIHIELKHVNL